MAFVTRGLFGTRGSLTTPPCAEPPRKISQAGRSRATLRRKLAHPQDTNTLAHERRPLPDVAPPAGFAEPSGGDDEHYRPSPPGQTRSRTPQTRQARPDRPPSRPRNRPRATGTSEPNATPSGAAGGASVCSMNRTCVRTVGGPSDGTDANTCTCPAVVPGIARNGSAMRVLRCRELQRELQVARALEQPLDMYCVAALDMYCVAAWRSRAGAVLSGGSRARCANYWGHGC